MYENNTIDERCFRLLAEACGMPETIEQNGEIRKMLQEFRDDVDKNQTTSKLL